MNESDYDWRHDLPEAFKAYSDGRDIDDVERTVPDLAGMSRGKAMPARKFSPDYLIHQPVSIFYQTMHVQQSVVDVATGRILFNNADGSERTNFRYFIPDPVDTRRSADNIRKSSGDPQHSGRAFLHDFRRGQA